MATRTLDGAPTRVQLFFDRLVSREPGGREWLPSLLGATARGRALLEELSEHPGSLETPLIARGVDGRLGCFDYPVPPPRDLLAWYIEHPERLVWPEDAGSTGEAVRLRRALLHDDPAGSQRRAQELALEQLPVRSAFSPVWWRFEEIALIDCVLMTPRLVVTIEGKPAGPVAPATAWYPPRSQLVRTLEAGRQIAAGRRWASLLLSDAPVPEGDADGLAAALPAAVPHLAPAERDELAEAYLGTLTWEAASAAVGLERKLNETG